MQENNTGDTKQNPEGEDAAGIEAGKRARSRELTRRTGKNNLHQIKDEDHSDDQSKYIH